MSAKMDEEIKRVQDLDIETIMRTENGRRFIWRILSVCGIYRDIVGETPEETARLLGRRSVGLWVLGIISDRNQEQVFTMMKEAQFEAKRLELMEEKEVEEKKKEDESKGLHEERRVVQLGVEQFIM